MAQLAQGRCQEERCAIRCLITGGAGFIGSHLVDESLKRGCETRILDNLSTGKLANLDHCRGDIEFINGDIRDLGQVEKVMKGIDLVFHHAALASVPRTVEDPLLSVDINDRGTLNVFLAARNAGVKRVVYASSSAVYGANLQMPHDENMTPAPQSPYAAHKLIGEHYGRMFGELYGLEVVSLRYFNVYGPRQDPSSPYSGVISIFLDRASRGLPPGIYGDGEQSRDFVFIQDVVTANFLAAEEENAAGFFNIGTGDSVTLNRMVSILSRVTGRTLAPVYQAARPGDIYESRAAVEKAASVLGFKAGVSFEDGLAKTWEWFRQGCE